MTMHDLARWSRCFVFTLVGSVLAGGGAARADVACDEKLADLQPPYAGPGHSGRTLSPEESRDLLGMAAQGINLAAWVPLGDFPGDNSRGSDIWGYVSPSGREYAILGMDQGAGFIEVTDPDSPVIVGFVPSNGTLWKEVTSYGEYAYVVADGSVGDITPGLQVIDLTEIDEGLVRRTDIVTTDGLANVHTVRANPASGWIYLHGSNLGGGGLLPYDVSDPAHPVPGPQIWSTSYVHDAVTVSYDEGPYAGKEISFVCGGWNGFYIVDVTDKQNLIELAHASYPNQNYCHYGWLSDDRTIFFIGDEFDELNGAVATSTTYMINVTNLSAPSFIGSFTNDNPAIDHNAVGVAHYFISANYRSGLRIFDWSDPLDVREVAFYDTYPLDDEPHFNGLWGCHRLPSGTVIGSDMQRGLFVFDVSPTVQVEPPIFVPEELALLAPSPNPFRDRTNITFDLVAPSQVSLDLFDLQGRRLARVAEGEYGVGRHVLPLRAAAGEGALASGTYWLVLRTPESELRRRVLRLR